MSAVRGAVHWLDTVDPGVHRRIKGLRLGTAYGIAALLALAYGNAHYAGAGPSLPSLAGGFALWASVSEGQRTRIGSSTNLALLCVSALLGAALTASLTPVLAEGGVAGPELSLVIGAFLAGYLRRFGILGTGFGSQFFIGQLLAYSADLSVGDVGTIAVAGAIAIVASIVPRVLSGPAEHPAIAPALVAGVASVGPEFAMGLQAAAAALVIVGLNGIVGLEESAWAITASTYVVANSLPGTFDRIWRRIAGTLVGVPLGLAFLPIALHVPILAWVAAAIAMVIYAMALPERYDIACAAFAFTLIVTLVVSGEHSLPLLAARLWETLLGGAIGLVTAFLVFPLRPATQVERAALPPSDSLPPG